MDFAGADARSRARPRGVVVGNPCSVQRRYLMHQSAVCLLNPEEFPDFFMHELFGEQWTEAALESAFADLYD